MMVPHLFGTRWNYYRRIFGAYLTRQTSQLTFWHDVPAVNEFTAGELGAYYMPFLGKADYTGHFDPAGIPLLDYLGAIGKQYNPIAISQYALGHFNAYFNSGDTARRRKFLLVADWLVNNLEQNQRGLFVWMHHFDFEYRTTLRAPWYSGLAQGQGLSVLVRAWRETQDARYLEAAHQAFAPMLVDVSMGGVHFTDSGGNRWIEEYIVDPPTHILNGFIWALWGVYDFWLATGDAEAGKLFRDCTGTLLNKLATYDTGYWSLYEQSGTRFKMLASPFYHRLHIAQLRIMHLLTGEALFQQTADRWEAYTGNRANRSRALIYKSIFKLCYY